MTNFSKNSRVVAGTALAAGALTLAIATTLRLAAPQPAIASPIAGVAVATPAPQDADGGRKSPPGGTSLLPADTLSTFRISGRTDAAEVQTVEVTGQPFTKALRVRTKLKVDPEYAVQLATKPIAGVTDGDIVLATFYVRAIQGQAETGEARSQFVFERGEEPFDKAVTQNISITREWRRIDIPFHIRATLPPEKATISLRLGYAPQVFEIGGLTITNYKNTVAFSDFPRTPSNYVGMEAGAAWRKAANARIEKIRKGDMKVVVVGANGKTIPNATVQVAMTRHAFPFGSAVAAEELLAQTPDGDKYRETISKMFNRVVMENDLKWGVWEGNAERSKKGVAWLSDHDIEVRGHNLIWPSWRNSPASLKTLANDKAALAKRINEHITGETTAMRGQVVEWDVINEPFDNHDVMDILGKNAMIGWFKIARQSDPKPTLFLNDYPPLDGEALDNAHLNSFEQNIKYLQDNGAPIGGIGFQCHVGGGVIPPARLVSGLDRFGKFGLPIAITEFDINTTDEKLQAAYMRDFLTATFSHPAVNSIIMWGFWEGRHWLPDAALYSKDWKIKPVGQAWLDLVQKEWKTNATGKTARDGSFKTRAFYGDYNITITTPDGKTKTTKAVLRKNASPAAPITVKL